MALANLVTTKNKLIAGGLTWALSFFSPTLSAAPYLLKSDILSAQATGKIDKSEINNKVQAKFEAQKIARKKAAESLRQQIANLPITQEQTLAQLSSLNQTFATRVQGSLQGAFVQSSSVQTVNGGVTADVTLGVCLNNFVEQCVGKQDLSNALLPLLEPESDIVERYKTEQYPQAIQRAFIFAVGQKNYSATLQTKIYTEQGHLVLQSSDLAQQDKKAFVWRAKTADLSGYKPMIVEVREVNGSDLIISENAAAAILANLRQSEIDGLFVVQF
ncbi:hypothetical protein [Gayadomonas joobiniege]|uniref:hypothetical protein n=1 Tax=Gayadomonas joobiniege TaxID=1234606 RepID=UPI00036DA88C|nr:hypothetical protein [Gayadomonas joobiniege]